MFDSNGISHAKADSFRHQRTFSQVSGSADESKVQVLGLPEFRPAGVKVAFPLPSQPLVALPPSASKCGTATLSLKKEPDH